jgi:hypothetical protein
MHLVQILLPLSDNEGNRFLRNLYARVRTELTERFGGLTAFTRAPAEGLWSEGGETTRDEIVILEVMTNDLDRDWWRAYRRELEVRFRQDVVVIRAQAIEPL